MAREAGSCGNSRRVDDEPPRFRVAILQPYVPDYRVPLLERVVNMLESIGGECLVFYGTSGCNRGSIRGDAAYPEWSQMVRELGFTLPRFGLIKLRILPRKWRKSDVFLVELAAANLDAWRLLLLRKRVILMGHGRGYTSVESKASIALESKMVRVATRILTYTESGRAAVLKRGKLEPDSVTAFNNTVETSSIRDGLSRLDGVDVQRLRATYGLAATSYCAVFVGALEIYKNIELLVDAAKLVLEADGDAALIVAGDGPERWRLGKLAAFGDRVVQLGHVDRSALTELAAIGDVLLCPGRVGLIAVDAMAMGLPLLSTLSSMNAPEIEYLQEGVNLFTSASSAESFSELWLSRPSIRSSDDTKAFLPPSLDHAAGVIVESIVGSLRTDLQR